MDITETNSFMEYIPISKGHLFSKFIMCNISETKSGIFMVWEMISL